MESVKMIYNEQLIRLLHDACRAAGSQRNWCDAHDMPEHKVSAILAGKMKMPPYIAKALGYEPVRDWVKINSNLK